MFGLGFRIQDLGFGVSLGFGALGLEFRGSGFELYKTIYLFTRGCGMPRILLWV